MAITSINSPPAPPSIPEAIPEFDKSTEDLGESIKKNIRESLDYQIIDKLLIQKEEPSSTHKIKKTDTKVSTADEDMLSLSKSALAISESELQLKQSNNSSSNQNNEANIASTQSIQASNSRLQFSGEATEEEVQTTDPIAFDLNGNGIETSGVNKGINFDIDGDGKKEQTSFISGGDAFLAYDKNGNGVIDNGKELFGDQNGAINGFEELAKYDDNKDGIIDKNDKIYSDLKLVSVDSNQQLKTASLSDHNIQSINLGYTNQHQAINYYDSVEQVSSFTRTDGSKGGAVDVMLGHKPAK